MKTLFDSTDREALLQRLQALGPDHPRQWGKMDLPQMLAHCSISMETPTGDRPMKQAFLGKLLTPLIRSTVLGEKPFSRNGPTDPSFVVSGSPDFEAERNRLVGLIHRLAERGPDAAGQAIHPFFGRLSGEEWGRLMHKHLDHHLRQFGA